MSQHNLYEHNHGFFTLIYDDAEKRVYVECNEEYVVSAGEIVMVFDQLLRGLRAGVIASEHVVFPASYPHGEKAMEMLKLMIRTGYGIDET